MTARVVSFVPGPAHVRDEVLAAMATPPAPHRSAAVTELLDRVQRRLRELLATECPVFPVLASATTAVEIALRGVARHRVLALVNGAFSARAVEIARALGLQVEELRVPFGEVVPPDAVARALAAGRFDTLTLTHCETQTGALHDLDGLAEVLAEHPDLAVVVDAVSSLGGVRIDFDRLGPGAVLVGQTSKALACPPGGSVLAVADGARRRAETATRGGFALDLGRLIRAARDGHTPQTPNTPLLHALDVQLAHGLAEGRSARDRRHRRMASLVETWAEDRWGVLADASCRSPTVTAIETAGRIDVPRLLAETERRGFRIAPGYGALADATFRIGHLGDVTLEQTESLIAVLDEVLTRPGVLR